MLKKLYRKLRSRKITEPVYGRRGDHVTIREPIVVTHPERLFLGDYVHIGEEARLATPGGLQIDRGVVIGPRLRVYTANHNYRDAETLPYDGRFLLQPVRICCNVWVGGDVVIVPGVTIGEGAVVGAGAVVVRDVPPMAVVGGNPAQIIRTRDRDQYDSLKAQDRIYLKLKAEGRIQIEEVSLN